MTKQELFKILQNNNMLKGLPDKEKSRRKLLHKIRQIGAKYNPLFLRKDMKIRYYTGLGNFTRPKTKIKKIGK